MSLEADLLAAFEEHSPERIRETLAAGISPTTPIKGAPPIHSLISAYLRSPRFAECLQVMLDAGATIGNPTLQAILLDDDALLRRLIHASPNSILDNQSITLTSAFTSCRGVSPLHICAEFNTTRCARILLEQGADVNAAAARDKNGIGGHTPIFHCVNSIFNYCRPVMELLVAAGADLDLRVTALLWGESMTWETIVYDVSPISYAQCGLYRQFHRREDHIYSNIEYLYSKREGSKPPIRNVPNAYLTTGH